MYWNELQYTIKCLRQRIYETVTTEEIEKFVTQHIELAAELAKLNSIFELRCTNLKEADIEFLELIDGDSYFKIKWINSFMGLECCISCSYDPPEYGSMDGLAFAP